MRGRARGVAPPGVAVARRSFGEGNDVEDVEITGVGAGSGQDGAADGAHVPTDPWRVLRRHQDRRRYLRILTLPRSGKDQPRRPGPGTGIARSDEPLLGPPASMTRTVTHTPRPQQVRHYLRHSCDLTVRGGPASAISAALATCGLAEHYVLRRVAGSSAGAVTAAAAAAAELGRGAPDPRRQAAGLTVVPGFAGLAEIVGWLAGQDVAGEAGGRSTGPRPAGDGWPEEHRLARLFQPGRSTRTAFRLGAALTRPGLRPRRRARAAAITCLAGMRPGARLAVLLLWLGSLVAEVGLVVALLRLSVPAALVIAVAVPMLVTFMLAALAGSAAAAALGLRRVLAGTAEPAGFGLVPGVLERPLPHRRADRRAGIPDPDGVPPLATWLADRLDDLAGVPPKDGGPGDLFADAGVPAGGERHEIRRPLTFGELWLGRVGPFSEDDVRRLRRAAQDGEHRVIDLALVSTDVSGGRPHTLPFPTGEASAAQGAHHWLFCRVCLEGALPTRVVDSMVSRSPAQETEGTCRRHREQTLHEVPEPWDFPVVAAVRMSMATPGLLSAVPLHTLEPDRSAPPVDVYGGSMPGGIAPSGTAQPGGTAQPSVVERLVPRTHWFCDGGITASVPVHVFDRHLPRWPTLCIDVEDPPGGAVEPGTDGSGGPGPWLSLPEQDAGPRARRWRPVGGAAGFLLGLVVAGSGWRDRLQTELPGFRGRVATVRRGAQDTGGIFLEQPAILRLALRGYHAGAGLVERFTGPDGDVPDQTQTDRYRWIRLRLALREYRRISLEIGARVPLYSDLASEYRVPADLTPWFDPPLTPGALDPAWPDAAAAITHLRALSAGGVLDWDTDDGAPPLHPDLRITPPY